MDLVRTLVVSVGGFVPITAAAAQDEPLGAYLRALPVESPGGVVIADDGRILVTEMVAGRIAVFAADGAAGDPIVPASPLRAPRDLDIGPDGNLYVADSGNHRVVVLAPDGTLVRAWGGVRQPWGLDVDGERVFVADTGNDRVLAFDLEGTPLLERGGRGAGDGSFRWPVAVAVGAAGELFVSDADNHRIQRFDAEGDVTETWGDFGTFPGLFSEPGGMTFHGGRLYVVDRLNHRVQVFDPKPGEDVRFGYQWGLHAVVPREGEGRIHYPTDIAVSPDGGLAVVCEPFEHRCQVFGRVTGDEPEVGTPPPLGVQGDFGSLIAVHGTLLAVWEPETRAVAVYDSSREIPINITRFGEPGHRFGQFGRISGMLIDGLDVFIADDAADRLGVFRLQLDPDARIKYDPFLARFVKSIEYGAMSRDMTAAGDRPRPGPAVLGPDGSFYMVNALASRIEVVGRDLKLRRTIEPTGGATLRAPTGVAFTAAGDALVISDGLDGRVVVVDAGTGAMRVAFDGAASPSPLVRPSGVAAGHDGFVYVSDQATDRVVKFDEGGEYRAHWGTRGGGSGEMWQPTGIAQDDRGRLYVLDYGNHRIQIFGPDGAWLVSFGTGRAYSRSRPPRPPAD